MRNALLAEVRRLVDKPASPAELDKIKVQILTGAFGTRQTPIGLASAIGDAAVLGGDRRLDHRGCAERSPRTPDERC